MTWWLRLRWPLVFITLIVSTFVGDWYVRIPEEWAIIRELRAQWDADDKELFVTLLVRKREHCGYVWVTKDLRRVEEAGKAGGYVQPVTRLAFRGHLNEKVQRLPVSKEWQLLDDVARPEDPNVSLEPGKYILTMIMFCEQAAESGGTEKALGGDDAGDGVYVPLEPSPTAKATLPARITLEIGTTATAEPTP